MVWVQRTNTTKEEVMTKPSLKVCGRHFILGNLSSFCVFDKKHTDDIVIGIILLFQM
jgi:hypothetical protein